MGHIFAVSIRYTLMGQKDGGRLPLPLFFAMEGEMLMKIGYIRVSTVEQNTIRQETLMEALGVDEIYMDKVSGKNTNRPELQKMLHYVRKGDTVIVKSISRFARNTKDLLELVEQLNAKEVEFISQKESIDTSTPAELEREYILQRQREGIAEAKKQGKYHGRKAKIHPDAERVIKRWKEKEITSTAAMQLLGVSKTTFYRMVRKFP